MVALFLPREKHFIFYRGRRKMDFISQILISLAALFIYDVMIVYVVKVDFVGVFYTG